MADTTATTLTTAAKLLSERWAREISLAANEEAIVRPYVTDVGRIENKLHLPQIAAITAQTTPADFTALTYSGATETEVTFTPATVYAAVSLDKNVDWQTVYDLHGPYRQQIVASVTQKIDTDIAGEASNASNTVGGAASDVDEALILAAKRVLITNAKAHYVAGKTPACLLVHPVETDHLQSINNLMQANVRGDAENPLVGGWARMGFGFIVKESGVVKQSAGTTYNWLFVKTAVGIGFNTSPEIVVDIQPYVLVTRIIAASNYDTAEIWDGDHVAILTTTTA